MFSSVSFLEYLKVLNTDRLLLEQQVKIDELSDKIGNIGKNNDDLSANNGILYEQIRDLSKHNDDLHNKIRDLQMKIDGMNNSGKSLDVVVENCEDEKSELKSLVNRLVDKSKLLLSLKLSDEQRNEVESIVKEVSEVEYDSCNKVRAFVGKMVDISKRYIRLVNLFEDLTGAVRVYVKVKGISNSVEDNIVYRFDKSSRLLNNKYRVFGYFDSSYTNEGMFLGDKMGGLCDEKYVCKSEVYMKFDGLNSVMNQLSSGYNVVLFGYGYSGSGKTYGLMGDSSKNVPGLLHYALSNLNPKNIVFNDVSILYTQQVRSDPYKGQMLALSGVVKDSGVDMYISSVMGVLERDGYVRKTKNNPKSSRCHTFYSVSLEFDDAVRSKLVVVDMAGREDPMDILSDYVDIGTTYKNIYPDGKAGSDEIKQLNSLVGYLVNMKKKKKKKKEEEEKEKIILKSSVELKLDDVITLFFEGLYINETINKLRYYLAKRSGKSMRMEMFSGYTDARNGGYNVNGVHINNSPDGNNKDWDHMIEQLKKYESKSKSKPTKYVMLCAVRQEKDYSSDIIKTLEFANSISSI